MYSFFFQEGSTNLTITVDIKAKKKHDLNGELLQSHYG